MANYKLQFNLSDPINLFCVGWCLILFVPIAPILPRLQTFIHPWRPELAASVVILITLAFLLYKNRNSTQILELSLQERNFIILPMVAFITWSGFSIVWASSWKSALYHTLVWTEYLIFYVITRQILARKSGLRSLAIPLTITLLLICLPPVFEYYTYLVFGGATTLGMRYAKYGELLNTVCPLLLVIVLRFKGKLFALGLSIIVAMWLFIISTLGRTNLVIFTTGLIIVSGAVFVFKRFHKYHCKMALASLAIIFVPLPFHLLSLLNEEPAVPIISRVSDDSAMAYSSDVRKLLKSVALEMFKAHPVIGVGADNFGMQFYKFRAVYAEKNPTDPNLMTAEVETAERSHNEFLQIIAELGIVGGLIFLYFLSGIALMAYNALRNFRRVSLLSIASLMGVAFFLASSLVTSYSFRLVQNGFIFFFVLAVAAKSLLASKNTKETANKILIPAGRLKIAYTLGIFACLLLAAHCLIRVTSVYYSHQAFAETDIERAMPFYEKSFRLDAEAPTPHYGLAMNLLYAKRYAEAAVQFRLCVDAQRGGSTDYSYLALAQSLAGDNDAAEKTFAEALRLYPLSTFVRTRYGVLLQENGKLKEAAEQFRIASEINKADAATWRVLITEGARKASLNAAQNKYSTVMQLTPLSAVYAIVAEREIKHPEEKFQIPKID